MADSLQDAERHGFVKVLAKYIIHDPGRGAPMAEVVCVDSPPIAPPSQIWAYCCGVQRMKLIMIMIMRLKMPPAISQLNMTIVMDQTSSLLHMLKTYRSETGEAKKAPLIEQAPA